MTDLFFYLIKVIICSGILFLYYAFALRNKLFHQWNRFYLLIAVVISLTAPIAQVTIYNNILERKDEGIQLLQVMESANQYLEDVSINGQAAPSSNTWVAICYLMVSMLLFVFLLRSILQILQIIRSHPVVPVHRIKFVETDVKGTPFSFFRFIFWNRNIDLQSNTGKQIFQHELVHVEEKHSLDKLFLQVVLIAFWCNPFFWLIRRELKLIHEFIADQKSVSQHGTAAFAAMILQSAYPGHFNALTNPFFQTSIKRRLQMLTKIQNPRLSYFSRIIALPLVVLTVLAFTIRTRNITPVVHLEKELNVVIDAGHGVMPNGQRNGARSGEQYEDDVVLAIARKVQSLNTNSKINIILTRASNDIVPLQERVQIAKEHQADLFISIHTNAQPGANTDSSGIEIYVPVGNEYQAKSALLGSALQQELKSIYKVKPFLETRANGVYVLNKNVCPAVLVECGYITNEKDRKFITTSSNQEQVAGSILKAIQRYADQLQTTGYNPVDTVPTTVLTVEEKIGDIKAQPKNFVKVDQEPMIDKTVWKSFLSEHLVPVIETYASKGGPAGTFVVPVRFIVRTDGTLSDIKVVKDPGHGLGDQLLQIMKRSPKWQPARIQGKPVNAYHTQPITFVVAEESGEIKTKP